MVDDIRNLLILNPDNREIKLDLFSLNVQRSRDHGIPSYNDCREKAGVGKVSHFNEITKIPAEAHNLEAVYEDVDDVELWVGVVCEEGKPDGVLGDVGGKVCGETFRKIRDGDRYWYEYAYPEEIVKEIKKTTLADVIKRNTGVMD